MSKQELNLFPTPAVYMAMRLYPTFVRRQLAIPFANIGKNPLAACMPQHGTHSQRNHSVMRRFIPIPQTVVPYPQAKGLHTKRMDSKLAT